MMGRTVAALVTLLILLAAVCAVLVFQPLPEVKATSAAGGCSDKMLAGSYGLVATGFYLHDSVNVPANLSVLVAFNGKGEFNASSLNMAANGAGVPTNPSFFSGGNYNVKPDCTFTATTPEEFGASVTVFGIVVNPNSGEIMGNLLSSDPNITGTFHAARVPSTAMPPVPPI